MTTDPSADAGAVGHPWPLPKGLSDTPIRWVDGGPISSWAPVHSRHAKPIAVSGQRAGFVVTKVANPPDDPVVQRWMEHQARLVEPIVPATADLYFWRLAVRLRSFAIDVHPRGDLESTFDRIRGLAARASEMRVTFGFVTGRPIPSWVVRVGDEPVFAGMPDHHLVPTTDEATSVATIVSLARIKPRVHDVTRHAVDFERHPQPALRLQGRW